MPIVDNLGIWEDLGSATPAPDWQIFPYFCKTANGLFRAYYNFTEDPTSDAWIRAIYFDGSSYIFDNRWLKIFPKDEPEIINYPYPPDLIKDPLPTRQIQIKKSRRYRRYYINSNQFNANWSIQLFEKQDTLVDYPVGSAVNSNSNIGSGDSGSGNSGGGVIGNNNNPGIIPGGGI